MLNNPTLSVDEQSEMVHDFYGVSKVTFLRYKIHLNHHQTVKIRPWLFKHWIVLYTWQILFSGEPIYPVDRRVNPMDNVVHLSNNGV